YASASRTGCPGDRKRRGGPMVTSTPSSVHEVKAEFDPRTASAKVRLVYGEPGTDTDAGVEAQPESPEPAGAGLDERAPGRDGSRRNALKDGMNAKAVFTPEMAEAVKRCTAMLTEVHKPTNEYETSLVNTMGRAGAQLESAAKKKFRDHDRCIARAMSHWDKD